MRPGVGRLLHLCRQHDLNTEHRTPAEATKIASFGAIIIYAGTQR